jgi:Ca2+-binding EF-hand superfamily protein
VKDWLAALAVVMLAGTAVADEGVDLLLGDVGKATRLRLQVVADGQSPTIAWEAFLDKLFDYFDRDGDGWLSPAEAARVIPLPLPGGAEVVLDFQKLDADRDGKASRAELKAYYHQAGFTPVVVILESPSARAWRLSEALFAQLDRDGDGKLSNTQLRDAPRLLRRLDEDDDEVLSPAEILASAKQTAGAPPRSQVRKVTSDHSSSPDAVLRIRVDASSCQVRASGKVIRERSVQGIAAMQMFDLTGSVLRVPATADGTTERWQSGRRFYLAQLETILGGKTAVAKQDLEDDPAARVLADLFAAADRDGDGKLTRAELEVFLNLVEQGVHSQVLLTITDRGRNLFDALDTNGDGQLDLTELHRAEQALAGGRVPLALRLDVRRGPPGDCFGPVLLGERSKPISAAHPPRGPSWFRAMDRNGDGFLSPCEFLGPPELFRRLDTDGDGRISVAEAERAAP